MFTMVCIGSLWTNDQVYWFSDQDLCIILTRNKRRSAPSFTMETPLFCDFPSQQQKQWQCTSKSSSSRIILTGNKRRWEALQWNPHCFATSCCSRPEYISTYKITAFNLIFDQFSSLLLSNILCPTFLKSSLAIFVNVILSQRQILSNKIEDQINFDLAQYKSNDKLSAP